MADLLRFSPKTVGFGACCWLESASCLLFYSGTLPMFFMADQRKILFWKHALISYNRIAPGV